MWGQYCVCAFALCSPRVIGCNKTIILPERLYFNFHLCLLRLFNQTCVDLFVVFFLLLRIFHSCRVSVYCMLSCDCFAVWFHCFPLFVGLFFIERIQICKETASTTGIQRCIQLHLFREAVDIYSLFSLPPRADQIIWSCWIALFFVCFIRNMFILPSTWYLSVPQSLNRYTSIIANDRLSIENQTRTGCSTWARI